MSEIWSEKYLTFFANFLLLFFLLCKIFVHFFFAAFFVSFFPPTGSAALFAAAASALAFYNFFNASTELMKVMARACGHNHLNQFEQRDITTWKKDMADLTGIKFAGIN